VSARVCVVHWQSRQGRAVTRYPRVSHAARARDSDCMLRERPLRVEPATGRPARVESVDTRDSEVRFAAQAACWEPRRILEANIESSRSRDIPRDKEPPAPGRTNRTVTDTPPRVLAGLGAPLAARQPLGAKTSHDYVRSTPSSPSAPPESALLIWVLIRRSTLRRGARQGGTGGEDICEPDLILLELRG
jgi:hypothetical protein